jgi:hypothetical protein
MRHDRLGQDSLVGAESGAWRLTTDEDLPLLTWGLRQRALWEQIHTVLLRLYGPHASRATIAATRDDDDYDNERYGYGDLQGWSEGEDWRDYEDQPFRVYDASGALLDVDLALPAWRVEAERADALSATFAWARPITPQLSRLAAQSARMNWTAEIPFDEDFGRWREFVCDVLRGVRFTLPREALTFDRSDPPPNPTGAIAVRADLLDALAAAKATEATAREAHRAGVIAGIAGGVTGGVGRQEPRST